MYNHGQLCTFPHCLSFGLWFGIVWCWQSISCFQLLASLPYMSIQEDYEAVKKRLYDISGLEAERMAKREKERDGNKSIEKTAALPAAVFYCLFRFEPFVSENLNSLKAKPKGMVILLKRHKNAIIQSAKHG